MQPIRTFIAIELNDALHRALADVQARLKRDTVARAIRWVAPENIHITLKFLGDVDAARIPALERAIAQVCNDFAPFTLTIGGAGAFPNMRKPNVIWVGARGQVDVAARLAEHIDAACATFGFAREERAFTPHLTLGRVKRDASPSERQRIGALIEAARIGDVGELRVERVAVMKSDLTPEGSVYTRLAECVLRRRTEDG
ncbi:MAG: RNA 2',3'-cyclic phosphodiesterase [Anaerolineae bacterium]|nr:RNA 2',3'-cyclic phosphodiesterase [Anaerolineae bacterium]